MHRRLAFRFLIVLALLAFACGLDAVSLVLPGAASSLGHSSRVRPSAYPTGFMEVPSRSTRPMMFRPAMQLGTFAVRSFDATFYECDDP